MPVPCGPAEHRGLHVTVRGGQLSRCLRTVALLGGCVKRRATLASGDRVVRWTVHNSRARVSARPPSGRSAAIDGRAAGASNPWLVIVIVCAAQFMVVLDATIVNVALPSLQRGLRFSASSLQWVINMYTLIFGGFMLLGGRAGDLIGRKRVFGAGIVLFSGASLLNGLAQSPEMLIAGRGLQGVGAALLAPAVLSIITTTFSDAGHARRHWRSGARSPQAVARSGCCWVAS